MELEGHAGLTNVGGKPLPLAGDLEVGGRYETRLRFDTASNAWMPEVTAGAVDAQWRWLEAEKFPGLAEHTRPLRVVFEVVQRSVRQGAGRKWTSVYVCRLQHAEPD